MADSELIIAVTSAILAAAALLFAIVQTASALSQYLASMNRCGRAITGSFELREGFFWSLLTLTLNPRYRMPVLTMPGLRSSIPRMEHGIRETDTLDPGTNFMQSTNSYMDRKVARIMGPQPPRDISYKRNISYKRTARAIAGRVIVSPLLIVYIPVCTVTCIPCLCLWMYDGVSTGEWSIESDTHFGCGGASPGSCLSWAAFWPSWIQDYTRDRNNPETTVSKVMITPTPGLEAASWAQLLMNYQATWWGHANIRWEWRLASLIPVDMYGATVETTMADLQLLVALGSMYFSSKEGVLSRSLCGEQVTMAQHSVLGPVCYYRSGRENIKTDIELSTPMQQGWLLHSVAARRLGHQHLPSAAKYNSRNIVLDSECKIATTTISELDIKNTITYLARERTIYDAQLSYSCGTALWALSLQGYITHSQNMPNEVPRQSPALAGPREANATSSARHQKNLSSEWVTTQIAVFWGPLGSGINFCSCIQCCRDWYHATTQEVANQAKENGLNSAWIASLRTPLLSCGGSFWPALEVTNWGQLLNAQASTKVVGPTSAIPRAEFRNLCVERPPPEVDILTQTCCAGTDPQPGICCGTVARLVGDSVELSSMDEILAVVALNTQWLRKVNEQKRRRAAEEIVFGVNNKAPEDSSQMDMIKTIICYKERLLLRLRPRIGSVNVWNSPLGPALDDFSPVALGA